MEKAMKVVHLNYFGQRGGAGGAISMRRLHHGLRRSGVDSKVLHLDGDESGGGGEFVRIDAPVPGRKIDRIRKSLVARLGLTVLDGVGHWRIKKNPVFADADVVTIHRLLGVTPVLGLPFLTAEKPTILVLCDNWALTGRCYYNLGCQRWQHGCGACPHQSIFPVTRVDGSRLEWILKRWAYRNSKLAVVTKCNRTTAMVKASVLNAAPVYQIPNGIDLDAYTQEDPEACRAAFEIPRGKKVLMFGAVNLNNYVKGGDLLVKALDCLPPSLKSQLVLLVMGKNGDHIAARAGIETIHLGYIDSIRDKVRAFTAADLFLCPSRGEIMGNVNLEAMACGTPVVAFRVGGIPDFVRPGESGYLAEPWDARAFSNGIVELLDDEAALDTMRLRCREIIADEYSIELKIDRYIQLYRQLMNQPPMSRA
jgi:glycosyltransferase involved in cell wall biosynthesis